MFVKDVFYKRFNCNQRKLYKLEITMWVILFRFIAVLQYLHHTCTLTLLTHIFQLEYFEQNQKLFVSFCFNTIFVWLLFNVCMIQDVLKLFIEMICIALFCDTHTYFHIGDISIF